MILLTPALQRCFKLRTTMGKRFKFLVYATTYSNPTACLHLKINETKLFSTVTPQSNITKTKEDFGRLDMRVGVVSAIEFHPNADSLYVEKIDIGECEPRTVVSGLVKFIHKEELLNQTVILLCNLKPSKIRSIISEGMVMCAATSENVELITPPEDSKAGDLVFVKGYERIPDSQLSPKKKIFEACLPFLTVNEDGVATYKGIPWTVNGKNCYCQTLKNVCIK